MPFFNGANRADIPAGTLMLFQQTAAPTGWVKQTTHDNKALRVVSGTAGSGGSTVFTSVFTNQTPTISGSVNATTLVTSQIPSHTHGYDRSNDRNLYNIRLDYGTGIANTALSGSSTGGAGGGGSHTHGLSASSSAITLNVQYVDLIIASKS